MKRLLSFFVAAGMLLALAACGHSDRPGSGDASTAREPDAAPAVRPAEPETSADTEPDGESGTSGGVLVAYYSATGSTAAVAGYIADALGGDTFEIVPAEPYTSEDLNWRNGDSRVSREHDDPALRTVELTGTTVDGWENYDTVFIGYPIWWGIAAWPVNGFVKANDFSGKTVIPFCTSASSGLGQSGELLAGMAKGGDWQEGRRFRGGVSTADVTAWVNGLDI